MGNILGTLELIAVVGHICLKNPFSTFTWPRDQSLGSVVVHLLDYTPIYGSTEKKQYNLSIQVRCDG
jgi:hypothetical protein